MKRLIILISLLFLFFSSQAQKQGNIWYFGSFAGLDFNSGKPVALSNGQLSTNEGCGSISDKIGHLLFYTDGINVWNRNHKKMPNGFSLAGNPSASQSGVIVPLKGDTNLYYVFTVDAQGGTKGIEYSIINMSSDNRNGDVVSKNNFLYGPACEKITAIPMTGDSGYWIITHQFGTDTFVTFGLTAKGLMKKEIKSNTGPVITKTNTANAIGYMVASPDNSKLAMANSALLNSEVFDFDNRTGVVSNPVALKSFGTDYGVCFSPNSKVLYISQEFATVNKLTHVQQYDLTASNIAASEYTIVTGDSGSYGAMQLGPDDKIYVAHPGKQYLEVIQLPDNVGSSCKFTFRGVSLGSRSSNFGLPNIPPFSFSRQSIHYISHCYLDTTIFYTLHNTETDSIIWIINYPNSKKLIIKQKDSIKQLLKDTGIYYIMLYTYTYGNFRTDSLFLHIAPSPFLNLGKDTVLCPSSPITLNAASGFTNYIWQDGSTKSNFTVQKGGKYWVVAQVNNCIKTDTINIAQINALIPKLKTLDTLICAGLGFKKDISQTGCHYLWNDGDTQAVKTINKEGLYTAKVYNPCSSIYDTFNIKIDAPLKYKPWKDTTICKETGLTLYAPDSLPGVWQDGSVRNKIKVTSAGKYFVTIFRKCETIIDTINIKVYPEIKPFRNIDTAICKGAVIHCNYTGQGAEYIWNDGYKYPLRDLKDAGRYYCTASNICYNTTDSILIKVDPPLITRLGKDTTLCPDKTLLLKAPDSAKIVWQNGSTEQTFFVNRAGLYKLLASNACGTLSDSIRISYSPKYFSTVPSDTILCDGDSFQANAYSIPGQYTWNNGINGSKITLKQNGPYILTFKNQCQTITDTIIIKIDSFCNCYLYTPDIFTPDNNGINDNWKPSSCSQYKSYYLQVYNRWGERVFASNNLNEGWDGNFKGKEATEDMYLYMIRIIDRHNTESYKSGRFYLIRH